MSVLRCFDALHTQLGTTEIAHMTKLPQPTVWRLCYTLQQLGYLVQAPDSDKFSYKMRWLDALRAWVAQELAAHPQLVLMGDFNIAPEDRDVYDPVAWAGQIHCTPEERAHFQALCGLGLVDAFRLFDQPPRIWSWWDYRNLAFRKNQGLRIDHILVSQALQPRVTACTVDKLPRKNERPSDHAPVLATLAD